MKSKNGSVNLSLKNMSRIIGNIHMPSKKILSFFISIKNIIYKFLTLTSIFLYFLHIECVYSYEPKDAANNLAHELVECAAFYSISSEAIKHKEKTQQTSSDLPKYYANAAEVFFGFSMKLTNKEVTISRYEMPYKEMLNDIHNDYSNISIIMNKYLDQCKKIHDNPEERLKYWLEKK